MSEHPELTLEEWEELDKRFLQEGIHKVYDEVIELEDEAGRQSFLKFVFYSEETKERYDLHEEAREIVQKSRIYHGHPVPNEEFFGLESPTPPQQTNAA